MTNAECKPGERAAEERFERLVEMPPSAKLVFRVLDDAEEPLSSDEVSERTLLVRRTVRYALNKLKDAEIVDERRDFTDARRLTYEVYDTERP